MFREIFILSFHSSFFHKLSLRLTESDCGHAKPSLGGVCGCLSPFSKFLLVSQAKNSTLLEDLKEGMSKTLIRC